MFINKNIHYFIISIFVIINNFSCTNNNINKPRSNDFEYYGYTDNTDSLLVYFPFLRLQDTLSQYYEMDNITSFDTIIEDYDWNLLTFEKIIFAKRKETECLLIGNLWGSKKAAIVFGIYDSNSFRKIYSKEINIIDSLKKTDINDLIFFEIESFYQTYCEKHVSYDIFIYHSPRFNNAFSELKSNIIINNDPLCSNGEYYNTFFRLTETNNLIELLSKKYYYNTQDSLITTYKFNKSSFTFY